MEDKWLDYNGLNKNFFNTTQLPWNDFVWNILLVNFFLIYYPYKPFVPLS